MNTYQEGNRDPNVKVLKFNSLENLYKKVDLTIPRSPMSDDQLLNHIDDILDNSVRVHHRNFHNQLISGQDMYSIAGDLVTANVNGFMCT